MATKQFQLNQTLLQFYDHPVSKVSLELVFSIVTISFFAIFAIRPTLITMANLSKEIDDKTALEEQLREKSAALSTLQTQYLSIENRLPILDKALPVSPDMPQILATIERLVSDRNLTILSMEVKDIPKDVTDAPDIHKLTRISRPIILTVTGDFPTIRQLVEDIRNLQQTMIVDSIIFSVTDQHGQKRLKATITINLQYLGTEK